MDPHEYQRLKDAFLQIRRRDAAAREAFLEKLDGRDPELAGGLRALLGHDECSGEFLSVPPLGPIRPEQLLEGSPPPTAPRFIGPFEVHEVLGVGGMGVVYRARQEHPRRWIALKMMHRLTESHVTRFRREADALARVSHPGIAEIYEAGVVETLLGEQPYIAMELVPGVPVHEFVERHDLSTRARVELLIGVGEAVQHAHAQGVIHRDLKPDNILVDDSGAPRVIDFGISAIVDPDAHRTETQALLGTLDYLSPEQISGETVDIRSDVYTLGVVAYLVLSGRLPCPVHRHSLADRVRRLSAGTPVPLREANPTLSRDLERVIMNALATDRNERYATVAAFVADLQRVVRGEPVTVHPTSLFYTLRKYAGRHRTPVAVAALMLLLLATGVVGLAKGYHEARKRLEEVQAARNEATREATRARNAFDFLADLLAQVRPDREGRDVRLLDLLDDAEERVELSLTDDPDGEAQIRHTLGRTYLALGELEQAEVQLERVVAIRREQGGEHLAEAIHSWHDLGVTYLEQGRLDEAAAILESVCRQHEGIVDRQSTRDIKARYNLALVHTQRGELEPAEALLRGALEDFTDPGESQLRIRVQCAGALMTVLRDTGRNDEALQLGEEAMELCRNSSRPRLDARISAMRALAGAYVRARRLDEAEPLFRETLARQEELHGPRHPHTTVTLNNLGRLLQERKEYEEAAALFRRAVEIRGEVLGPRSQKTLIARNNLAVLLYDLEQTEEALAELRDIITISREAHGERHWPAGVFLSNLGDLLTREERYDEAHHTLEQAVTLLMDTRGLDYGGTKLARRRLAAVIALRSGD